MKAIRLRTEYLNNPMGIDITAPRLSWHCGGGIRQTAYEILARDDMGHSLWSTGKVSSSQMHLIPWGGEALKSRSAVRWQVRLWDENDAEGPLSEEASFELGLLTAADWKAQWITGNYSPKKNARYSVDCFRKEIPLRAEIKKARLYATACGLYELCINGSKAGSFCLAPGYTDYNKRIQYQTIDVTELLRAAGSTAVLTAQLADGWYRGAVGAHGLTCAYGKETKLLAQLEILYADGSTDTICTDAGWSWSNDGPIRFADNKDGEILDARMSPSYSGKAKRSSHPVLPTASNNVPLQEAEQFAGEKSFSPAGKLLLNFGQNLAGCISFTVNAQAGQRIRVRLGELIGEDGELTQKNIQCMHKGQPTPKQEILYTCIDGENRYKSRFTIAGFQYAEVSFEGAEADTAAALAESFTAFSHAVYSAFEETGSFTSSNELLNRFVHATKWSTKSNSADIPTDCPTRERHGWTGDAQIFFETANLLFDYAAFSEKYLRDVYDWQKPGGRLPQIAPYGGTDFYMATMNGSVGWSDIGVLYPWRFYKLYGDKRILEEYYDRMKAYARFMESRCGKWGGVYAKRFPLSPEAKKFLVNRGQSYGEWAEPKDVKDITWTDFCAPHPEVSTAYTAYVMDHMAQIAALLGRGEDIAEYRHYAAGCRMAYRELLETKDYSLDTDRQAQLVRPLFMKLLTPEQEAYAKQRLLTAMEHYGWRLGTGFLSTPFIMKVLADIDVEAAYRLLENEALPGWLSMPKAGATTIWEAWEGPNANGGIASLNHYSKGAVVEWLFEEMCGIHVAGENRFVIKPLPGGHFTHAAASYTSAYGTVESSWERDASGTLRYRVVIPANTTAELTLPDGRSELLLPGTYTL